MIVYKSRTAAAISTKYSSLSRGRYTGFGSNPRLRTKFDSPSTPKVSSISLSTLSTDGTSPECSERAFHHPIKANHAKSTQQIQGNIQTEKLSLRKIPEKCVALWQLQQRTNICVPVRHAREVRYDMHAPEPALITKDFTRKGKKPEFESTVGYDLNRHLQTQYLLHGSCSHTQAHRGDNKDTQPESQGQSMGSSTCRYASFP